MNHVAVAKQ